MTLMPLIGVIPEWADQALCGQSDPELWFPEQGDGARAVAAKRICSVCPVREQCLDYALRTREMQGIWGGHSPDERRRMLGRPTKSHHPPPKPLHTCPHCGYTTTSPQSYAGHVSGHTRRQDVRTA